MVINKKGCRISTSIDAANLTSYSINLYPLFIIL
nr:MAG TPA: hypothetical protein [Caudoviricetes sp.]